MKRRHKPEQIIHKLRHAEVLLGQGKKTEEVCRDLGVSDATYYKWRREYGGMGVSQAKKLGHPQKPPKRARTRNNFMDYQDGMKRVMFQN